MEESVVRLAKRDNDQIYNVFMMAIILEHIGPVTRVSKESIEAAAKLLCTTGRMTIEDDGLDGYVVNIE